MSSTRPPRIPALAGPIHFHLCWGPSPVAATVRNNNAALSTTCTDGTGKVCNHVCGKDAVRSRAEGTACLGAHGRREQATRPNLLLSRWGLGAGATRALKSRVLLLSMLWAQPPLSPAAHSRLLPSLARGQWWEEPQAACQVSGEHWGTGRPTFREPHSCGALGFSERFL